MTFWQLLRDVKLFRLLRVRWTGQLTDGIFQSALASFVLFSPERQASAVNAAVAFTVVLLPYSIVGPFVGTILDRFSRQRAIFYANLTRAITLVVIAFLIFNNYTGVEITVVVLVAFGVNRLILAGLSAGIPLMTNPKSLISANAIAELIVDGKAVAHAGELHPRIVAKYGLPERSVAFAVGLSALPDSELVRPTTVGTMPAALQDVALIVGADVTAAQVEAALRAGAGDLLESITLFDRYDKLGDGKISLAFSLVFRAPDRTLTGAEVTEMREAAVAAAVKATGAVLRTA